MKTVDKVTFLLFFLICTGTQTMYAQITPGVYFSKVKKTVHEVKLTDNYFTYTTYDKSPAKFIKTVGGFYHIEDNLMEVLLEFNSNYTQDSVRQLRLPFETRGNILVLDMKSKMELKQAPKSNQDLDGQWMFGTRGPDQGQERRGDSKARKTLKFLQDGRFQWIAYNTETMMFSGTGGGSFISKNGVYQENIEFFSKDDSRVGAELIFEYNIQGDDWHHQGKNSKGEPMYEIWVKRKR
ncbi:hypothetical protein [Maribacter polysaccharolyticus]|uniref:hypothetical protein n=1 Tax=Maribacter polysaccharolyticus TaxID=3020831 RepID=UPI00237F201B|nr:hypothetical protein [Maribacter polysaccharolyticus]MDE3742410.1 hypothetical protein [Maribacter polysaccharolyticus]